MLEYKVFWCKTNKYFTEKWMDHPFLEGKKGVFIASCVVTDRAKAKWVKFAKKKLAMLPEEDFLFLSGCWNLKNGMIDPQFFETYHELAPYKERIVLLPEDPEDYGKDRSTLMKEKIRNFQILSSKAQIFTRKYMVIQMGCDNFCTFCLTVQARGRHKSRPKEEIIEEINEFIQNGGKEVVLTGTNLGAWGALSSNDFKDSKFVELIHSILEETPIERIRISSLGVEFLSDACIALFSETRINAYVHLSIQSGSDPILKRMNRHYDAHFLREVLKKLKKIERPDWVELNIWADLIVGFPGETDEDFEATKELVSDYGITQLHAFPFSAHDSHYSIPAWKFEDQIAEHIKMERLRSLLALGKTELEKFCTSHHGKTVRVLIEKTDGVSTFQWWSENYLFCNELNCQIPYETIFKRWTVIEWIYHYNSSVTFENPEQEGEK